MLGFDVTLLDGRPAASFSVQRWKAPPGAGAIPVHLHRRTEEAFYVLDGEMGLWLDGHVNASPAGSSEQEVIAGRVVGAVQRNEPRDDRAARAREVSGEASHLDTEEVVMAQTKRRLSEAQRAARRARDWERLQHAARELLASDGWQRWVRPGAVS